MTKRVQIEAAPQGGYVLYLAHPTGGFLELHFSGSLDECIKLLGAYFQQMEATER